MRKISTNNYMREVKKIKIIIKRLIFFSRDNLKEKIKLTLTLIVINF